jgi:hypothetical protein
MIPKSGQRFRKRSSSSNKLKRDDDSKKSHPALGPRGVVAASEAWARTISAMPDKSATIVRARSSGGIGRKT